MKLKTISALTLLAGGFVAFAQSDSALVMTDSGFVRGVVEKDLTVYRGIPFAAPPVGDLRWRPPQPADKWDEVRDASKFAPDPYQGNGGGKVSEDCLYLNIWTPAQSPGERIPVLVWIYGGGFAGGSTSTPVHNGEHLARKGVVLVSINYRVGTLGFLAHPELSAESPRKASGNYGLLDQIAGLKWVQANIAKFGGDPGRVTIFGESAGGIAVSMLCASPEAKGLFHGAISQSGGSFGPTRPTTYPGENMKTLTQAEQEGVAYAKSAGVTSPTELRRIAPGALPRGRGWPIVDGWVIPDDQYRLYEAGRYNDVDILVGYNSDEGLSFSRERTPAEFIANVEKRYGPFAAKLLKAYPVGENRVSKTARDLMRDAAFGWQTWAWARLQARTGKSKVFYYYFDQHPKRAEGSPQFDHGTPHGVDVPYVFQTLDRNRPDLTAGDWAISETVAAYWANFAKRGDPNGPDLPVWPRFTEKDGKVMYFKEQAQPGPVPSADALVVLDSYFAWRRTPEGQAWANLNPTAASADPKFQVYLCFGQSNMEAGARPEAQDGGELDPRFQMLAAVDMPRLNRTNGHWYVATPPLNRQENNMGPVDWFGRNMVANLPRDYRVGVINVSVAGARIELWEKDTYTNYLNSAASWMQNICKQYDGNPYQRLVTMARIAQQKGMIKGILLHQGESNPGDPQWCNKVKGIYDHLMRDLKLNPDEVPLIAGELVSVEEKGKCAAFNTHVLANLPKTLPNAHIVSSQGCQGTGDGLHFAIAGMRELGKRYAQQMLKLQGISFQDVERPGLLPTAVNQPAATRHWTADNGNGTYSNPLFYEEFEDPDIIRVGDDYYLAGTTMHMNPAVQIMHSRDLVNWELVGYGMDRLDLGPAFRLEGGNIYGRGIWAPCLRYHAGTFYIFSNVNGVGLQVFRSKSIQGPWERNPLPGRHDLSVLFDDDGRIYIISGGSSPYPIEELAPDLRSFNADAPKRALVGRMGEGHHLYKIDGKYVDVSAIPGGPVDQMVAIADSIDGPWKIERMVQGESLGVTAAAPRRAQPNDRGLWLHQGGIVDTPSGEWWSVIMSDHGSAGRMVALVPITWDNGFPLIGLPGNLRKAPNTWIKPNTGHHQEPKPAFIHDDNFDGPKLNPHAQWNHVPDDTKWSLTEKPGVLRLHSLPAPNFYSARNSLCQRPPGPESIMTVELDTSGLGVGDTAGLALLSSPDAWIGVVKTAKGTALHMFTGGGGRRRGPGAAAPDPTNAPTIGPTTPPTHLWLRVHCNFDQDEAIFSWSADGRQFTPLGKPFTMTFQLTTFQGVRPALFNYSTTGQPGGYADFDNYTVEEPRARGIEREIPLGRTITLSSGADGSFLAADPQNHALVNVATDAAGAVPEHAKFQVVDLGKGRVALQTANGRFVSAAAEAAVLKDLAGTTPGTAESFQWVNLMFGDTMFLSLTNHRYLATRPHEPGPVTVTATGPRPARKSGAEFKWKAVE